jgi:hypothetical protein
MAQDEAGTNDAIAVAERPAPAPATPASGASAQKKRKKSKDEEEFGYDVDFETPFGKIEFALEPASVKERKDRERRERAERDAAKAAARAAKKAEKQVKRGDAEQQLAVSAGGSKLVPVILIFLLVAGVVALAIWLFARPGDEKPDAVPAEFRNDDAAAEPEPQGFAAKAQQRIRNAVHAGRQASREAQAEQERRFQDLTGKK